MYKLCRMSKTLLKYFRKQLKIRDIREIKDPRKISAIRYEINQNMEWNGKCIQLHLTCVTGNAQSRLSYLLYLLDSCLTAETLQASQYASTSVHGNAWYCR